MKRAIALLLCVTLGVLAFVPKDDDPIEKLIGSLQKWAETNPQEKVYLHTDKPYYALGDTIWFKAYVTIGSRHQLSALSGALYVDLINERDSIQQTLKLPVTAGMAIGDFVLSDTLNEGNYRIRSYTQWMRNAGEDYFFDRTFMVGNAFSNEVGIKAEYQYKTIDNKPVVTAVLNYKDDEGNLLSDREVSYELVANGTTIVNKSKKTDVNGNISIDMLNNQKSNLRGAYIKTTVFADNKVKVTKVIPIKAALSQTDVQFFPESGALVNGISSRVGFKAVGTDGSAVAIKGIVTDNENKEVVSFESEHAGMGMFNLKAEQGKSYKAKITYADGSETSLALPKVEQQGYVLAVYQTSNDSLLVRINASADQVKDPQLVSLIAQSAGEVIYGSRLKIVKPSTSVWLPKKDFSTGITQFTLFNGSGEPLNERIVFIKNSDLMQLKLSAAKSEYKSKEKVEMELDAKDHMGKPSVGNFSVTVIDQEKLQSDENLESTILSNILLTSDLKGYIEKPNYYFLKDSEEVNRALDNLMLTQGYRRFVWKELLNPVQNKPVYKAEHLGAEISGKVVTLGNKPVANAKVTLMSLKAGIVQDTITDAEGRFKFTGLVLKDSIKFAVQARTVKNGKQIEVVLDTVSKQLLTKNRNIADVNTDIPASIKAYLENSKKQDQALAKMGGLSRTQRLREVNIRAKKLQSEKYTAQGMFQVPEGHSDQTYIMEDGDKCATLGICLQGRLYGITFTNYQKGYCSIANYPHVRSGNILSPVSVFLDGRKVSDCDELRGILELNVIDPASIGKIDVVRLSMTFDQGIYIVTKRGWEKRPRYIPSITNISPKGFNKARMFYSPCYDQPNTNINLPDLRSTIYWNPTLKTNEDGKLKFDFFNADGPGDYKVVVEGINAAGELGRLVFNYKVN